MTFERIPGQEELKEQVSLVARHLLGQRRSKANSIRLRWYILYKLLNVAVIFLQVSTLNILLGQPFACYVLGKPYD